MGRNSQRPRAQRRAAREADPVPAAVQLPPQSGLIMGILRESDGAVSPNTLMSDHGEAFATMEWPFGDPAHQPRAQAMIAIDFGIKFLADNGLVEVEQCQMSTAKRVVLTDRGRELLDAA